MLDHIDSTIPRPTDIDDGLWERLDAIVLQWIYGTISNDLLYKVLDEKATALVVWSRLRNLFHNNKGTHVVHLENQFSQTRLQDFATLDEYCQDLRTISVQLDAICHPISEERLVLQLVARLTEEYKTIATIIQQTVPLPSFEEACSSLDLDRRSREHSFPDGGSSPATTLVAQTDNQPAGYSHSHSHSGNKGGCGNKNYKGKNKWNNSGNKGGGNGGWNNQHGGGNGGGNNRGTQQQHQVVVNPWAQY